MASSSSRSAIIGPSLPPTDSMRNATASDSDDDSFVGPAPPPQSGGGSEELSYGERTFLEREQRRQEAEAVSTYRRLLVTSSEADRCLPDLLIIFQDAKAAAEAASSYRPEWMLAPPPSMSFTSTLASGGGALKARGFSQNSRVQRSSGPSASAGTEDMTLWTETPQQRMDRLKNEVHGNVSVSEHDLEEERSKEMAARRDREIRDQVNRLDQGSNRTMSLLEQHQAKRREESRAEESKKKSRRRRDYSDSEEEEEDREERRRRRKEKERDERDREGSSRRHRHRSRSRSPDRQRDHSRRHRDEEDDHRRRRSHRSDRSRSRSRDRDSRRKEGSSSSSSRHRSHRKSSRSASPEPRSSSHRKDKDKDKKKKQREEETGKGGASTMIWDREKAMSFIPLMDEAKRNKALRDARGLGDRFGGSSGGSKFL